MEKALPVSDRGVVCPYPGEGERKYEREKKKSERKCRSY
jgi:hypothetical protein